MRIVTRFLMAVLAAMSLVGCEITTTGGPVVQEAPRQPAQPVLLGDGVSSRFRQVVERVAPVAVSACREQARGRRCDFLIVVDDRPGLPPNAFQTLDRSGRPVIGFTASLVANARNADELAFILGHEAAHHIQGHIPQAQQRATEGALLGTVLGAALGLDAAGIDTAQRIGGTIGARRYSKDFELQADALGTVIAARAGYDPVRGAEYFARIPDPGNRFLGTHPPNADRIATVRRVAAGL